LTCRNHELQRLLRLAASAANLQQNLASELRSSPGPAPYMRRGASVAGPDELQALVEVARLDRKQRLGTRMAGW
jgi:hypothetical protein